MWQELINFINNDPTVSGIIASILGNTLSVPISDGLRKLFSKKVEVQTLTVESCKQIGIKDEDLEKLLKEIEQLKDNMIHIDQENEEGLNDNELEGLSGVKGNVWISQKNKKGDNKLKIKR